MQTSMIEIVGMIAGLIFATVMCVLAVVVAVPAESQQSKNPIQTNAEQESGTFIPFNDAYIYGSSMYGGMPF